MGRHLAWEGCVNARDLGGMPTGDGRGTRWGAVVRCDSVDRLTAEGWRALERHGIRTIVDLRNDVERAAAPYTCDLDVVHVPIEDDTDREFVRRWRPFSTPHYYAAALAQWPDRAAGAVAAVARARPGGVVVHCGLGRDRTGLIVMLLLALVGVAPEDIADDYELSAGRLPPPDPDALVASASLVNPRSRSQLEDDLATERRRRGERSDREALLGTLDALDVAAYLRA
ncbi:MAG: tyrosine-protein phosphatase, partial [Actinomycetota bacterium]|nr:tyrosine-protein phosphatase [Actinomycetota bacterium]